jgi:hypothetical protein
MPLLRKAVDHASKHQVRLWNLDAPEPGNVTSCLAFLLNSCLLSCHCSFLLDSIPALLRGCERLALAFLLFLYSVSLAASDLLHFAPSCRSIVRSFSYPNLPLTSQRPPISKRFTRALQFLSSRPSDYRTSRISFPSRHLPEPCRGQSTSSVLIVGHGGSARPSILEAIFGGCTPARRREGTNIGQQIGVDDIRTATS